MTGLCAYCGAPAEHRHHLTGRPAPKAPYLDPDLTVALCRSCHLSDHHAWRLTGLDRISEPIPARLARAGFTLGRLGSLGKPLPAYVCIPAADCLADIVGQLLTQHSELTRSPEREVNYQ